MQQPDQGRATSVTVAPPPQAAAPQGFGRPVIVMKNAAKRFGDAVAVEGLNFTVHEGEIFGFIGPSGSGKTTTIRLMNGTYAPSEGSVTVFGEPAGAMPGRVRESIGYLPQLFILYPNLSVKENIDFSASLYGLSWFGRRKRRREVLEFVELWDHRGKLARDISGGMQRRLGLASSLIHDPRLIFLDEPTAGIDPILRAKFWDAFRELKAQGRSLFVTTQYVTEAEYCDHVAVLGHGQVIAVDTPENLRALAYGGEIIDVRAAQIGHATRPLFARLAGVRSIDTSVPGRARLVVEDAPSSMPGVMEVLRGENIEVEGIEQYRPTFDEVFVRLVERHQEETGETLEEAARA
ncbi:MAG: ABC transporter ATP-binding protein [Anaerolineae bacterium]|jgi:ABC-2 type transport system ATP-binding protein|nr:ABC transporter ATP-binding protein [Anaerolineae bacterium]